MTDAITATERYADACANGQQNDAIIAGAMLKGWATKLFRLKYANDASEYPEVLAYFKEIATQHSRRMKWGDDAKARSCAKKVLDYWLADNCPACFGRGYEVMPGSPMLSDTPCPVCQGQKTRNLEGNGEWLARSYILFGYIKDQEREKGIELMKRLRADMDF